MKRVIRCAIAIALVTLTAHSLQAGKKNDKGANFAALFYNDAIVGTIMTPTSIPDQGVDVIYALTNPADGQLGITTVAPGDPNYHGGRWKVYVATWVGEGPTPLFTSAAAVDDAVDAGDLLLTRAGAFDFICPVQVNGPKS